MGLSTLNAGVPRFVLLVRSAYWVALLLIAATAMTSYATVRDMLASHQRQEAVIALLGEQKMMSQRIGLLATATTYAAPERQRGYLSEFRGALAVFDTNDWRLHGALDALPDSEAGKARELFGANGLGLDRDTAELSARGWRLADAVGIRLGTSGSDAGAQARDLPGIDKDIAERTLAGYTAMTDMLTAREADRLERLLATHRNMFWALIAVIAIVILAVFRPMAQLVQRKTDELVEARDTMGVIAVQDALTGLNNRTVLSGAFETMTKATTGTKASTGTTAGAGPAGEDQAIAVIQFDLDRFKQINDTLGHGGGDVVLVATARRLKEQCGDGDVCVRMGGDEFVVLARSAQQPGAVEAHVRRILDCINQPVVVEGAVIRPGASAGVALYPADGETLAELLLHADLALYAAKRQGGCSHAFFDRALKEEFRDREQLEAELKAAIAGRKLVIHYQPKVALPGGEIVGVEALPRWHHPRHGLVDGARLVPLAVRAGLLGEMGRMLAEQAIADAAAWNRSGLDFGRLALDIGEMQLREEGFAAHLFATLNASGLPLQKLALEVRGEVMAEPVNADAARKLRTIRAAGAHVELDQFGAANAALASVSREAVDRLKIDSALVANIENRLEDARIVRAVADLARQAGIPVLAIGVETQAALDAVMALGCTEVQGNAVAFPMPEAQMREWILARSAATGPAARLNVMKAMFEQDTAIRLLTVVRSS